MLVPLQSEIFTVIVSGLSRLSSILPPAPVHRHSHHVALQGFLAPGTDITPIVPALEKIWAEALGQSMASFNFRTVTSKFNELVYQYPIRIPERYSLVIRCVFLPPNSLGAFNWKRLDGGEVD
jgi:hypothetical protein